MKNEYTQTEQVLLDMFTENTGKHFLDSGDHYGRQWQRNQAKGQDAIHDAPQATLSVDEYDINFTISAYHFCLEHLEYSEEYQNLFEAFIESEDPEGEMYDLQRADQFVNSYLSETCGAIVSGIYGEGEPLCVNTYNHESNLSQTLQYYYCDVKGAYDPDTNEPLPDATLIVLQVHGGCDVRGGYTAPKCFVTNGCHDETMFLCNQGGASGCDDDGDHFWTTDDCYHWYAQGTCGAGADKQLDEYEKVEIESADQWVEGKLCYLADGTAFCPIDGGKLSAAIF